MKANCRKPNLFIVGAPKSGTTALFHYLSEHPNVYASPLKEPHFFATDLKRGISDIDEYLSLFAPANDQHLILGEAFVWYLYSSSAIRNIHRFMPEARVIAMLRNPVGLVYSEHAQLVYNFEEDEHDFEKAWKLQEKRRRGEALPRYVVNPEFLDYANIGKLGYQVERLMSVIPKDQLRIILHEDFQADTADAYKQTLKFLDLTDDGRESFPRINQNCVHRSQIVGRFIRKPPRHLQKIIKEIERRTGREQFWGINGLTRINTKSQKRPDLRPAFRRELQEVFRDDVEKLSGLIDRDLSHWQNS